VPLLLGIFWQQGQKPPFLNPLAPVGRRLGQASDLVTTPPKKITVARIGRIRSSLPHGVGGIEFHEQSIFQIAAGASCAVLTTVGAANSGGLKRGGYNIDLLFDPSRYAGETSATYVMPERELNNVVDINPLNGIGSNGIGGGATNGVGDTEDYWLPRIGFKAGIGENVDCMADYSQPWGAYQPWPQLDGRERQYRNQDRERQLRRDLLLQVSGRQGSTSLHRPCVQGGPTFVRSLDLLYRDGWTVSGGVGHRFNDQWSAAGSITWDRGTTTGIGTQTDTWTFGGGVAYTPTPNVELRLAGALGILTSGSVGPVVQDGITFGDEVTYDFDNDLVSAISAQLKVKW
jgi:long-subunit fatty acid transport protein